MRTFYLPLIPRVNPAARGICVGAWTVHPPTCNRIELKPSIFCSNGISRTAYTMFQMETSGMFHHLSTRDAGLWASLDGVVTLATEHELYGQLRRCDHQPRKSSHTAARSQNNWRGPPLLDPLSVLGPCGPSSRSQAQPVPVAS